MLVKSIHLTEPELQTLRQQLYDAEDLAAILQLLDINDLLHPDDGSHPAHVATLTPFIRHRINEAVTLLNVIESRTFSKGHTPKPAR